MSLTDNTTVAAIPVDSSASAVSWAAIIAGALGATAVTLILMLVGSGLGLSLVSPWSGQSSSAVTLGATAAVWMILTQWLSAVLGGYLAGRLRTKWTGIHTDEVFFRDTVHGFLAWALATLIVVSLLGSALTSALGTGVQATATIAGTTAAAGVASTAGDKDGASGSGFSTAYFTDALLRPDQNNAAPTAQSNEQASAEASRILVNAAAAGQMPDNDRSYLATLVASRTGLSQDEARARVDATLKSIEDAKNAAKKAADDAKKAATGIALVGALSLLIGAFIASVAAAFGGRLRDDDPRFMH
ncbi:hypothetical protein [Rhizobium halophytocola]|uniref:PhnA-like protein n=1 Tax=Rhizobium halophytocola TaxID=735519 RepID=A0ABS4DYF7_9HYPH|nr:hypothetical protein [Rhizobium halophytocola]MBP1850684.1 hypothetical protein [Rhizobium halophytocola]